jgi:hypothetical protein
MTATSLSLLAAAKSSHQADGSSAVPRQPGCMANSAFAAGNRVSPVLPQLSLRLSASAAGLVGVGIVTGLVSYLHRSPVRAAQVPGTSAWIQHLIVAAVACALYGAARWRNGRRPRRGSGTLLLLAPLGRSAAARLAATMRSKPSWRPVAALPPLAMIGYGLWRIGEQITGGLDPNFTANAWGGPTYLGAMACHCLDAGLIVATCAWLLNRILVPASADRSRLAGSRCARNRRSLGYPDGQRNRSRWSRPRPRP